MTPGGFIKFQPYANGRRPSRCKWFDFEVDGLLYNIMGAREPIATTVRRAGWPDHPDEEIGQALCALVKGW